MNLTSETMFKYFGRTP